MRRTTLHASLPLLLAALFLSASPTDLPGLFHKAKEQFRLGSYADALATLDVIANEAELPENTNLRASLRPGLSFYRGSCLAMLSRTEEAREQFEVFLAYSPNANLDPGTYPKKVIAALEETRRDLRKPRETAAAEASAAAPAPASAPAPQGEESAIAAAYRGYRKSDNGRQPLLSEDWAGGPVRFLLTPEERHAFEVLSDPVSRSEFVNAFWKSRDPRPETVENEFREEFDKRVAFADSHFTENEVRGSVTDRGMVFLLLGPPTYVGRKPIRTGEDTSDPTGMVRFTRNDVTTVEKTNGSGSATNVKIENMTGPANAMPDARARWREVWHYRREVLPPGLPYTQVDFEFITSSGYGNNVLQREPTTLNALDAARRAIVVDRSVSRTSR
jgi:GWxTD domain-containing protein